VLFRSGGGQIHIGSSSIGGDLIIGGGTIRIDAPVRGDITIGGGEIYLNAPVSGNVRIRADQITLGPRANITGSFNYSSRNEAVLESGAVIQGETVFNKIEIRKGRHAFPGFAAILSVSLLIRLLMFFVGATVFAMIFKRYARELVEKAMAQPFREIGRGLITLIVLPVTSVLLLVTIIGIPLGILGLIAFAGLIAFLCIASPVVLGSMVHRWVFKPKDYKISWTTILLGVVLYLALDLIPFLGWILKLLVILLTFGALVNIKWSIAKHWR